MSTETLRPSGVGSETNIDDEDPEFDTHWTLVDEVSADDDTTCVKTASATYLRDLYALADSSGSGTINSVKVYVRARAGAGTPTQASMKICLKSGGTVGEDTEHTLTTDTWIDYDNTWTTNPDGDGAWGSDWSVIDALEVGVSLRQNNATSGQKSFCTQVWVVVDYHTDYPITTSCGLTASATIDRDVAYKRATTPGLTVSAMVSRALTYTRATTPGLTISATVDRVLAYTRATSAGLTVSVTIARSVVRTITVTANLGVSVTISKLVHYARAIIAKLQKYDTVTTELTRNPASRSELDYYETVEVDFGRKK